MNRQNLFLIAAVALFASCPAGAQTPSVPAPPPPVAHPRPMVGPPQGEPTAARRESASQIVELLHPDYQLSLILANKLNPVAEHLATESPDNVDRIRAAQAAESKVMKDTLPTLKLLMVEGFAREMTQDQLDGTLKFFQTPPGLAFSKAQGRLPLYFEITGADMWRGYIHSMLVDFCAQTTCTDQDRQRMGGGRR